MTKETHQSTMDKIFSVEKSISRTLEALNNLVSHSNKCKELLLKEKTEKESFDPYKF